MALPAAGNPISVSQINVEMGQPSNRTVSLLTLAQEWYTQTGDPKFNITTNISLSLWYGETLTVVTPPSAPSTVNIYWDSGSFWYDMEFTDNSDNETNFPYDVEDDNSGVWYNVGDAVAQTGTGVVYLFGAIESSQITATSTFRVRIKASNSAGDSAYAYSSDIAVQH